MKLDAVQTKSLDLFNMVKQRLKALNAPGALITIEKGCRSDSVFIRKEDKTIEVGYEPYSPPYCFVKTDAGGFKRIERKAPFPAGVNLATGTWSDALLSTHEKEIRNYLDWLIPKIQQELKA